VLTIAVLLGVKYGIEGVAAMVTISAVLLFSIIQRITNKLIDLACTIISKQSIQQ